MKYKLREIEIEVDGIIEIPHRGIGIKIIEKEFFDGYCEDSDQAITITKTYVQYLEAIMEDK